MERVILHCDLNSFYASVEILENPDLVGKPVAVCGNPLKRHGIVLAKSEEAKSFGVKTGEAIWEAKNKCPELICVPPRHSKYGYYSRLAWNVYTNYTDRVESFGIDECWLDVTGSTKILGDGKTIADSIREEMVDKLGLTVSVGVSFNKIFAKLGSDLKKPNATVVINRDNFREKIWGLPANNILMVGGKTFATLKKYNIFTLGELANANRELLVKNLGIVGGLIVDYARGEDYSEVAFATDSVPPQSIGNGTTTPKDLCNEEEIKPVVYAIAECVSTRLRRKKLVASCLSVSIRNSELFSFTRQLSLSFPIDTATDIAVNALQIIKQNYNFDSMLPIRSVTISVHKLSSPIKGVQANFFDTSSVKESKLEHSIDQIREKYGYTTIQRGIILQNMYICDNLSPDED